ncbi:MAG: PP2C family protein-serine/threonine phosphatase [Myxococcota bacterium]
MSLVEPQIEAIVRNLLVGALSERDAIRALHELASDDATEAERLKFARQYDALSETLDGMVAAIEEFKGIHGTTAPELDRTLNLARRRFAILLSAALFDEPLSTDTEASLSASTSIRRMRTRLSKLADSVAELVEATIRDSQLRKELEIAGTVQKMLVPAQVVEVAGLVAHGWYRGAEQCSGDWWTLAPAGSRDAVVVVGDVTGHGAPAAIIVGIVRGALDMALLGMGDGLKPYMAMNMLNHILIDSVDGEYFMTAVVARWQPDTRTLTVANAGHRAPWLMSGTGTRPLKGHRNPPLGTARGQRYQEDAIRVAPGEVLIAFTDGLVEACAPDGRPFGERALRAVCEAAYPGGAGAIRDAVKQAVEAHVGVPTQLTDDVTFVVVDPG